MPLYPWLLLAISLSLSIPLVQTVKYTLKYSATVFTYVFILHLVDLVGGKLCPIWYKIGVLKRDFRRLMLVFKILRGSLMSKHVHELFRFLKIFDCEVRNSRFYVFALNFQIIAFYRTEALKIYRWCRCSQRLRGHVNLEQK